MNAFPQVRPQDSEPADSPSEQQIRESQKMESIGRLVGGVAHDFNNLLTGIVLCAELLLAGLEPENRLRRYAEEICTAGAQGATLIHQLLAVARQRTVEPRLLSLNEVIGGMRNLLLRLIGENIEIVGELADDLSLVKLDLAQAQQIVLNLALNARDAMPDGGRMEISTRNCEEWIGRSNEPRVLGSCIELVVADTGCGMDAATRAHLFEPFFTTKPPGQGNGLGLATINSIVKREGGSIKVESEPGKGTRIAIYLPQAKPGNDPAERGVATSSTRPADAATNRKRG
jgi:two-component system, cell cycle sensor histidine kinase and response regulator CckA